jgi:hypothetical protein
VSLPIQELSPGTLSTAWKRELAPCHSENLLERLWKHDSSRWPAEEHEAALIKSNLQWLDLPTQIEPCVSYVAIMPFFELAPKYADTMRELRDRVRFELGMPVQVTVGLRYLQAWGWSYKEGPPHGIFIVITAEPVEDVAIPGAD